MTLHSAFIALIVICNFVKPAKAETQIEGKQSLGLYYTSNANLSATDKVGDTFTRLDSRWYGEINNQNFFLALSWLNYTKEKSNNMLGVTLATEEDRQGLIAGEFKIIPRVFHRNYIENSATTSDTSFTNSGLGLDLEKSWEPQNRLFLTADVGYESRHFPQFNNRWDHELHLTGDVHFDLNSRIKLFGFSGFGFVVSSLSAYSRSFFDLGGGAEGPINKEWSWAADLSYSQTHYSHRRLDEVTEITNRRGKVTSGSISTNESTLLTVFRASFSYTNNPIWSIKSGLLSSEQSSNNEVNRYSNFEIFTSLILNAP